MSAITFKATLRSLDLGGSRSPGSARFECEAGHVIKIDALTTAQTDALSEAFNEPGAFTVTFAANAGDAA